LGLFYLDVTYNTNSDLLWIHGGGAESCTCCGNVVEVCDWSGVCVEGCGLCVEGCGLCVDGWGMGRGEDGWAVGWDGGGWDCGVGGCGMG
jgi:hypothetical protein